MEKEYQDEKFEPDALTSDSLIKKFKKASLERIIVQAKSFQMIHTNKIAKLLNILAILEG